LMDWVLTGQLIRVESFQKPRGQIVTGFLWTNRYRILVFPSTMDIYTVDCYL
jgi:hypothetical protein